MAVSIDFRAFVHAEVGCVPSFLVGRRRDKPSNQGSRPDSCFRRSIRRHAKHWHPVPTTGILYYPRKWDAPLFDSNMDGISPMEYIASEQLECSMPTRNVVLTEHQENLVAGLVASGRYRNVSETIRAGLRLLEREEAELTALSQRLAKGVKQAMDGELAEGTGSDAIRRAFAKARPA